MVCYSENLDEGNNYLEYSNRGIFGVGVTTSSSGGLHFMVINKLTKHAKEVIINFSADKNTNAGRLLEAIFDSTGLGSTIQKNFPKLRIQKTHKVDLNNLVREAYNHSVQFKHSYVGTEHLLLALLRLSSSPDYNQVSSHVSKINTFPGSYRGLERVNKTPILSAYSINLNEEHLSEQGDSLIHREEVSTLVSILLQKNYSNALVVGESGVGKRSLIDLLVHKINILEVPAPLASYKVLEFDLVSFIASLSNKESIEFGLASLMEEIASSGNVIIVIKNFQNLFLTTGAGITVPLIFSLLFSDLNDAGVPVIATITPSLFDRVTVDSDHILEKFSSLSLEEPDEQTTRKVLKKKAKYLSYHHNVHINPEVVDYVFEKANDIKDVKFPQKGLDLIDLSCTKLLIKKNNIPRKYKSMVNKKLSLMENVQKSLAESNYKSALRYRKKLTKLNLVLANETKNLFKNNLVLTNLEVDEALYDFGLSKDSRTKFDIDLLGRLAEKIKEKIVGQNEAIETVVKSLVRSKLGLRPRKRPLGNFLFLGPTGVGKTELAKVLAECAFEDNLIRLDMSDFGEKHTVSRLVGAPPGYVGYGEGGELTAKIENNPDSVVLFDEIEKAHPEVLNILLQIMEEAELSDARGNTFDFSKAVVVLTSNIGTDLVNKRDIGYGSDIGDDSRLEGKLKTNLKKILKPELINRFDEVVIFKRLKSKDQLRVVDLLIDEVKDTLKKQRISLNIGIKPRKLLLKLGYSDEYGARSLRRTVETELLDRIAEILLKVNKRPLKLKAEVIRDKLTVKID